MSMLSFRCLVCFFSLLWLPVISAIASGDDPCQSPDGNFSCELGALPYLAPENDTRINLILLKAERLHLNLADEQITDAQQDDLIAPSYYADVVGTTFPLHNEEIHATYRLGQQTVATSLAAMMGIPTADFPPFSSLLDTQEGRCISNNLLSTLQFMVALSTDNTLSAAERQDLAAFRLKMIALPMCAEEENTIRYPHLAQATGAANTFSHYLVAASQFYQGQYSPAESAFRQLGQSSQPWVAETATYMLARVAINQAQEGTLDKYGFMMSEKISQTKLSQAEQHLNNYLHHYPTGMYAESAKRMYRRIYWMGGDIERLAANYQHALDTQTSLTGLIDTVFEADLRLLGNKQLLAQPTADLALTEALMAFRHPADLDPDVLTPLRTLLATQQRHDELNYLNMLIAYYRQDYAGVLSQSTSVKSQGALTLLPLSQQILRGDTLIELQRWDEAESLWRQLVVRQKNKVQNLLVQSRLANTLALSGQVDAIFARDSLVKSLYIRSPFLFYISENQLRQQASDSHINSKERTLALNTLLVNELLYGRYSQFLQDTQLRSELLPTDQALPVDLTQFDWQGVSQSDGYACPSLQDIVESLSSATNNPRAHNCLSDFFRITSVDNTSERSNAADKVRDLHLHVFNQQQASQSRMATYLQLIAETHIPREDKSYALYRAIYCYAPSGYNHCGDEDIPLATRKMWFQQLKNQYKDTRWGKKIKYYW